MKVYIVEKIGKIRVGTEPETLPDEIIDYEIRGVFDSMEKAKSFVLDWLNNYNETFIGKDIYWGVNKDLDQEDVITVKSYEVA